jgi:hypothetical protein
MPALRKRKKAGDAALGVSPNHPVRLRPSHSLL